MSHVVDLRPDGAASLYACGWDCARIGAVCEVSPDVVRLWLRARDVDLRADDARALASRRPLRVSGAADRRVRGAR